MKTYLHGLIDYAGTLELIFRVGDVGLPERNRYTSSREEEEEDAHMCPCGEAEESRAHILGECETYQEERDVSEQTRRIDECDMEKLAH